MTTTNNIPTMSEMANMLQAMQLQLAQQAEREKALMAELEKTKQASVSGRHADSGLTVEPHQCVDARPATGKLKAKPAAIYPPAVRIRVAGMSVKSHCSITSNYAATMLAQLKSGELEKALNAVIAAHAAYEAQRDAGIASGLYGR